MKILVIAPHGDDEVLGCGGTISRYSKEDHEVDLCIISEPHIPQWSTEYIENRKSEIAKSCDTLGIKRLTAMGLPSTMLDRDVTHPEMIERIEEVIRTSEPDILYIPFHGDVHQDHKKVAECCMVACRPDRYKIKKVLMYETLSETEWGKGLFKPDVYVDISKHIERKIKAMGCYDSEIKDYPHPRSISGITSLARRRGSEANIPYAEAFMLVREII